MIICAKCGINNPSDARYCQNCGNALIRICVNCQTPNASEASFCKQCGQRLDTADEPHKSPVRTGSSLSEGWGGERRIVTILFCDVIGSTSLGEQLDPEMWTEIMNEIFECLIGAVNRYEGTVARLLGDAILAFFGAPIAHEDDPFRAVLAGLDMLTDLRPIREDVKKRLVLAGLEPESSDLSVRIGINTGLVVVGNVGSDQRREYTAMGDAINLASRMEQSARPGTIQVAHDTYNLIAPFVEAESLGSIQIKGKRDPVKAYRILGVKPRSMRILETEDIESPLVGRDLEMNLLNDALQQIREGSGQVVFLIGEAGLGKSRLIQEFQEIADDLPVRMRNKSEDSVPGQSSNHDFLWYDAESLSPYFCTKTCKQRRFLFNLSNLMQTEAISNPDLGAK